VLTVRCCRWPLLQGLLLLDRGKLGLDTVAGITLAALGIPEVMGYKKNCGTPVVTGLYTLLLLVIAFALLGGSRHLVVAADSATAAILASMLVVVAGGALGFARWRRLGSGTRS
jgi:SulP family sulfate permease